MKLSSQETVEVHMSPPSLARLKGSIVVDMGNRGEIDLRVKSNGATNVDLYSPNKKGARPEPVSRIHLIPLLMIFVFFILWAGSSEILPEGESMDLTEPEIFVMRMPTPNNFATSEQLKAFNEGISQHGARTALHHDRASHSHHVSHSLSTTSLSEKPYMRGSTR